MATSRDFVYDEQGEMLPSDSSAAAARRKELGITPKMPTRPGQQASGTKAKPKVVTKEELEKSGFDNLRDYMNAKKGLKRRGSAASTPAAKKEETSVDSAVMAGEARRRQKSPVMNDEKRKRNAAANVAAAKLANRYNSISEDMYNPGSNAAAFAERGGMKKGGRVTASSASKRADGIAQRGKTRGKVY
jgi:hypothetical protein